MVGITEKAKAGLRVAGAALAIAAITACAPIVRHHGYAPSDADLAQLQAGQTTRASVISTFGPPKTSSALVGNTDYYVYSKFSTFGPFAPREVERQVVAVDYTSGGVVRDVARSLLVTALSDKLDLNSNIDIGSGMNIPVELSDEVPYRAAIVSPEPGMEWGRMEMIAIDDDPRLEGEDLSGRCGFPVGIQHVVYDAAQAEGFDPEAYDRKLGLSEKGLTSVLVMPIGYRAKDDFFSSLKKVRKTVAESTLEL